MGAHEIRVEYAITYDDGEIDAMGSRTACVRALAAIGEGIAAGDYTEDDYAGRRIVKRTVTTMTSDWEPTS